MLATDDPPLDLGEGVDLRKVCGCKGAAGCGDSGGTRLQELRSGFDCFHGRCACTTGCSLWSLAQALAQAPSISRQRAEASHWRHHTMSAPPLPHPPSEPPFS